MVGDRRRERPERADLERGVDRAQEQPASLIAAHQIGMLALPPKPRRLRERLLHHGCGIDEHLEVDPRRFRHQPARERLQRALDDVVIVAALRIGRDTPHPALARQRERIGRRGVAHAERDHALHLGPQPGGRFAVVRALLHPDHPAVQPLAQPLLQPLGGLGRRVGRRDPAGDEAEFARFGRKALFERQSVNHCPPHSVFAPRLSKPGALFYTANTALRIGATRRGSSWTIIWRSAPPA